MIDVLQLHRSAVWLAPSVCILVATSGLACDRNQSAPHKTQRQKEESAQVPSKPGKREPTSDKPAPARSSANSPPVVTPTPLPAKGEPYWAELANLGYFGAAGSAEARRTRSQCPGADPGTSLLGTEASEWFLSEWFNSERLTLRELRGRVVVVRFWLAPGCPFCEKSMPALQALADEFRDQPVTFVGAFHAKPADSVQDMTGPVEIATKKWNVRFPLAMDREWKTLRTWWIDTGHRHATSITFVIGKDGRIAFIHPGPVFHPSEDPEEVRQNSDHLALRDAIQKNLTQKHRVVTPPESSPLGEFRKATGYGGWPSVTVDSESIGHQRRLYFKTGESLFVSDTFTRNGRVGVVEAIHLAPAGTTDEQRLGEQFLMFDPISGERLKRYPKSLDFPVEGAQSSSQTDAPDVCLLCHLGDAPLIRVHGPDAQERFEAARQSGNGMSMRLGTAREVSATSAGSINSLNSALYGHGQDRVFDVLEHHRGRPGDAPARPRSSPR